MSTDICRWLFLLFFLTRWTSFTNSKEIRVVCYYTNWSVYRPGTAKFSPQNINPYLCTHLVYAFGGFTKENTLKPFDKYQDIEKGGYAKFTGLKTYNKNLKTLLAIGGWNEGSSRFSPMVANPERRKELIKNAVKFLRQNHFDGLDLDWEYPSFRDGGKSRDKDNYAQLVQELREEFERESEKTGRPRLLLTMAVPAGIEYINKGYDVPKLTKYLDWMNILSYDYHSAFEPAVNHHAPLYSLEEPSEYNYDTELNIDYTIKHYLKLGADPNKLVMGIPTYGRSYTLFNPDANEIGSPADGPGDMGEATRENGYLAYYEICEYIKSQDWEVVQPNPDAMGPYAYKGNQWVGFDDDAIARKKAAYVAENGLGGIMFWSIDNDDFRGNCHNKPYPIIEAAKEALISAYGLTDENLVSPPAKPIKARTRTRSQTTSKPDVENSEKKRPTTSRRRNRIKPKTSDSSSIRQKPRAKVSRRTTTAPVYSSLELVTPSYTTPAPPSTPDQGGGFKCEDEGFYPHPKDCKKYYWCLSGPGELGIIAHQFTCPAGLYFNKAADSCDYTRNVLCNKKISKPTTTTTTTSTEASTSKTTSRVPPKITAATSRTTVFRTTTTTTEAYEDEEYEYEDEEDVEDNRNAEEDPKVIKELLDLIKKAGGIEQLEKQLRIHEDGSASVSHPDATTPSSISKSLVERVLGKAKNVKTRPNSYSFLNRNSRGPQNEGLAKTEEKQEKARPQYTTITRQRTQKATEEDVDDEVNKDDKDTPKTFVKKQPEYVNIRRGRLSTTTEEPEEDSKGQINRNKILGEEEEEEIDEEEDDEPSSRRPSTPQYVNIRRQRPSTTEETSTSKYTIIRRGSTTESNTEDNNETLKTKQRGTTTPPSEDTSDGKRRGTTTPSSTTSSKYRILRRGSTTESSVEGTELPNNEDDSSQIKSRRRGTTLPTTQSTLEGKTRGTTTSSNTESSSVSDEETGSKSRYKGSKLGSTTETTAIANEANPNDETSTDESTLRYSTVSQITSTQKSDDVTSHSDTENPVTIIEQLLITTPDSLSVKTTSSLTSGSKSTDSSESQTPASEKRTPLLLEPRPFSLSTAGPSSTIKPVTESSTRTTKVSESNYKLRVRPKVPNTQSDTISTTERPSPFRTRAPSRFKPITTSSPESQTSRSTINPSVRARKRFSTTTTEAYSDNNYEEYELSRTYRPLEIADLSSLTAVDFAAVKELNRFSGGSRRGRPRPTITTNKPEETVKPSSRPQIRKFSDNRNRRVRPSNNDAILEDQINSSSDTTHRIREFTRAPSRFTTAPPTTEPTRYTPRNRKIIRRLRPITKPKSQISVDHDAKTRFTQNNNGDKENLIESASSNPLLNRRFSRPTTEHTELNYKLSSTTEILKTTTQEDDELNETSDDVSGEEGENIKLSESNIRENSNVNNNNVLSSDDGKNRRRKVLKRIRSKVDGKDDEVVTTEKFSTEPNIIIRTRKIIRKLKPTESTILTSTTEPTSASTPGRKRKIIRRLRPTTAASETKYDSATEKSLHLRGRPVVSHFNTEKPLENEKDASLVQKKYPTLSKTLKKSDLLNEKATHVEDEIEETEHSTLRSKYKTILRQHPTTDEPSNESEDDEVPIYPKTTSSKLKYKTYTPRTTKISQNPTNRRTIDRSIYSTINRGTTSSTSRYDLNLQPTSSSHEERDDDDDEAEEEKEEIHEATPKYRIHRPTIPDDESVEDDENSTSQSPKYRIFRPTLTEKNDENTEKNAKPRILRPSLNESQEEEIGEENHTTPMLSTTTIKPKNESKDTTDDENIELAVTTEYQNLLLDESNSTNVNKTHEQLEINQETLNSTENSLEHEERNNTKEHDDEEEIYATTVSDLDENDNNRNNTDEDEQEIHTTVRNYVNPILTRQKNRPTFKPPKLTTPSTTKSTLASRPKYRSYNRFTTKSSNLNATTERSEENNNQETGRKFVPKNSSRTRYSTNGRINRTETTSTTESLLSTSETSIPTVEILNVTTITESSNEVDSTTFDNNENSIELTEMTTLLYTHTTEEYIENNVTEETTVNNEKSTALTQMDDTTLKSDEATSTTSTTQKTTPLYYTISSTPEVLSQLNETTAEDVTTYNETEILETTTLSFENITESTVNEIIFNETTINNTETSTVNSENTTTETTPLYIPKSTLRPAQERPKYNVPKQFKTTQTDTTSNNRKSTNRFRQRNQGRTTSRLLTPNLRSTTPVLAPRSRFNYKKYSTTERTSFVTDDENDEETEDDKVDDAHDDFEEEIEEEGIYTPRTPSSYTPRTQFTAKPKTRSSNRPSGYSFRKTTEAPKVTEDLSGINVGAVKNRNKNLFSKKRKMNVPFAGNAANVNEEKTITNEEKSTTNEEKSTTDEDKSIIVNEEKQTTTPATVSTTEGLLLTTTPLISESVTKPSTNEFETTESLTTLHHVFAETDLVADKNAETTTASLIETTTNAASAKVEKLIEVNRIVEVHEKNNSHLDTENKVIDKVGVINRVTVVKVVDGNPEENEINETTSASTTVASSNDDIALKINGTFIIPEIASVSEISNTQFKNTFNPFEEAESERQDRKYEIYGNSKITDYSSKDSKGGKENAEIIDGISNINIITPRPHYNTEASTISLEGLFHSDSSQKLKPSNDEELLETGHSRYVNVRILGQDEKEGKKIRDDSKFVNLFSPEDYLTMKAEVVEVTPKISQETIKIVPIKVEMSKKIIGGADFKTRMEEGVPKVNFKIITSENH